MRVIDIAISLQENGTSGFILKDLTDIQESGFELDSNEVNSEWLRVNDIVFLDFITRNTLNDPKTETFIYPVNSLSDYRKYLVEYTGEDGWYTITHLVIPKISWLESVDTKYVQDGVFYCYDDKNSNFVKVTKTLDTISYFEIDPYIIYTSVDNPMLIGVEEEIFLIGHLERCFENKMKSILYGNLYTKCQNTRDRNSIFRDRDIVWMTLELLKYLIRYCKYHEAERILEMSSGCNGFCSQSNFVDVYKFNKGCNCGN